MIPETLLVLRIFRYFACDSGITANVSPLSCKVIRKIEEFMQNYLNLRTYTLDSAVRRYSYIVSTCLADALKVSSLKTLNPLVYAIKMRRKERKKDLFLEYNFRTYYDRIVAF